MDRGRAGGFITDNNYFGMQVKRKQRREHLLRLQKIKNRKPGSSVTLDNRPPVVANSVAEDPRKAASADQFHYIMEKENKSLLKRISLILTAPPKITDKEYLEMKKLCKSSKDDPRTKFEKAVLDNKMKVFFERVKKTGPYYSHKRWEQEHRDQQKSQRFMRQVKYRRPPDFQDPFSQAAEEPSSASTLKPKRSASEPHDLRRRTQNHTSPPPSAHVHRIRAQRELTDSSPEHPHTSDERRELSTSPHPQDGAGVHNVDDDLISPSEEHNFFPYTDRPDVHEQRRELGSLDRFIKITREVGPLDLISSPEEAADYLPGRVTCFLLEAQDAVVLTAEAQDVRQGSVVIISAEAEITLSDLAVIGDCAPGEMLDDLALHDLAQDIIENVELRRHGESEARLVLSLVNENAEDGDSVEDRAAAVRAMDAASLDATSVASEEEVMRLLLAPRSPTVFDSGMRLLVTYQLLSAATTLSLTTILGSVARAGGTRPEHVYALVKVSLEGDDQVVVTAMTVQATQHVFKKGNRVRPAVPTGAIVKLKVAIPSLIQADPDLIVSFSENLVTTLKIEHDCKTGENNLVVAGS